MIYSFGREDEVDRAVLERLAKSISRFLSPEQAWEVEKLTGEAPDEFQFQSCKHLGGVWLLDQLWRQLGLGEILHSLFTSRHHQISLERLIFAMVANCALHPSSKLAMKEWVEKDVYIPHLPQVASHQLYRAIDELLAVQPELERQVFHAMAD